jgi:hypothetical protein
MAEPSETPPENNSTIITTIQPATKLGGRGTPRRKIRRPNNNNHSALVAAHTLENKLKSFRTQFQLHDQQELCDVNILYEDGRVDMQKQVHMHSTWPMTIHEIDSSITGTQTHHINDFDSSSSAYLFGNINDLKNKFNNQSTTNSSNSFNNTQQRPLYSQPPRYYMNYVSYQQNPYTVNSYENYASNIRQIYGSVNDNSDEEKEEHNLISTNTKKKKRRRKHSKILPEQSSSIISEQKEEEEEDEEEVTVDKKSIEYLENENVITTNPKRKRRRIRKPKKSLPSSSITGEQSQSSIVIEQPASSLINEKTNQNTSSSSSSSPTPTQHAERMKKQQMTSTKAGIHANGSASIEDALNILKNDEKNKEKEKEEVQPTNFPARTTDITTENITHTTTLVVDVDKAEDENEKIAHPIVHHSVITNISSELNNTNNETLDQQVSIEQQTATNEFDSKQPCQQQPLSDHIQVNKSYILYQNKSFLFIEALREIIY